jgi:hypothetical protein
VYDPQERGESVSRRGHQYRPDELGDRSRMLLIDLLRRDLHVDQRGLDLRMSHQLHAGWQAHADNPRLGTYAHVEYLGA